MKNKGFTLIELLAVIVILAIIAIIAVPIVLNIINSSRKSAEVRSAEMYAKALQNASAQYMLNNNGEAPSSIEDILDYLDYDGKEVNCDMLGIGEDGNVYVSDCKINDQIIYSGNDKVFSYGKVPNTLKAKILSDNTSYPDNTSSEYVNSNNGISIKDASEREYCEINGEEYMYAYDKESCESIHNYCGFYSNTTQENCNSFNMGDLIIADGVWKKVYNGKGLYYTSSNTQNNKKTYYFRGDVDNNYVNFAGILWRIVRINEDGSIRLITNESQFSTYFNGEMDEYEYIRAYNIKYVGYMYGTDESSFDKIYDSNMKTHIDSWYESNLKQSYSSYLADAGFCGDTTRSINNNNNFAICDRYDSGNYQFKCNNSSDLYTVSNSIGNKKLKYPIGLLTADEYKYAADYLSSNYDYTLTYYLMTPEGFYDHSWMYQPSNAGVSNSSEIAYGISNDAGSDFNVRPVINLKSSVVYLQGNGTLESPYQIKY